MISVNYITPITDRTYADVVYARNHQEDLNNKHKGAFNYVDMNRICNNLRYAAERMHEKGFVSQPFQMQLKLDWVEKDIITYGQLNTMIVNNMNNLRTYSRTDLNWKEIPAIINLNYTTLNAIEYDIDLLATQEPLPPDMFKLTVNGGEGTGEYKANTNVVIQAYPPKEGLIFDHWSGDHLENLSNPSSAVATYIMPHQDVTLEANYTGTITHKLTVKTHSGTTTANLLMGKNFTIEADPAPYGKVFHHWEVTPEEYESSLYEPAASTHITMPNEDVTLTAVYITKGKKQLEVKNGKGSGLYEYGTYVAISSNKPSNGIFSRWSGDTQYLTGPVTEEYNSVKIPDVSYITLTASWTTPAPPPTPPRPPVENVELEVINGVITSTGLTTGTFTEGDVVSIASDPTPTGYVSTGVRHSGGGKLYGSGVLIGTTKATVTYTFRELVYHNLTVTTHSGTTTETLEAYDRFSLDASPYPEGYTFDLWRGDNHSFNHNSSGHNKLDPHSPQTSTCMGYEDRVITADYRPILEHTVTVIQLDGTEHVYTQAEFTEISIQADPVPDGYRFGYWSVSGKGHIDNTNSMNAKFTVGDGDATIKPNYIKVWHVQVIGGTFKSGYNQTFTERVVDEGTSFSLNCRQLAVYEHFDGWSLEGAGTITNLAATSTSFTVGKGDVVITANISEYPDRTLTVYMQHPETHEETLVTTITKRHGSSVSIEAPVAPDRSTFSSWLGDVNFISPSALASTINVNISSDITITATYYYPETPEYYTLTVYDGTPESGSYAAGSQVPIRARTPNQGWEFYKWYGDTQYLVNPDLTLDINSVIIPLKAVTLYAKFKGVGELALYRVSVTEGIASATYTDSTGRVHEESGVYIDIPAGTEVTLTANADIPGWVFDYWDGNFETAGVTDIVKTQNPTTFTMTENDLNVNMIRRELEKYAVFPTNAIAPENRVYVGTYPIRGSLIDTDERRYTFDHWECVDADGNDMSSAIADINTVESEITLTDRDLWLTAVYIVKYKLTVVKGQDTGIGFYEEGVPVNSIAADTPAPEERVIFDHWDDPFGIVENIYDPTPIIRMKDSIATITAVYVTIETKGNSVVVTGNDLHTGVILRERTTPINGIYTVGTLVFDRDGCLGVITQVNPDENDNTNDFATKKLFYGGSK